MSFTSLELSASPIDVVVQRHSGADIQHNGLLNEAVFGLDVDGNVAYFDTSGPDPGEAATLYWDGAVGGWFLYAANGTTDTPLQSGPPLHMMVAWGQRHQARRTVLVLADDASLSQQARRLARKRTSVPAAPASAPVTLTGGSARQAERHAARQRRRVA